MAAQLWHKAPFIRLLVALAGGICGQWYLQLPLQTLVICGFVCFCVVGFYGFTAIKTKYRLSTFNGVFLILMVACTGGLVVSCNDIRQQANWFGHTYQAGKFISVTIQEPLVEKANSFKALARVDAICQGQTELPTVGTVILYFKKDSLPNTLEYGSRLLLSQTLQPIKNAGNPGSFDYRTYSLFKGITHQAFLAMQDYVVLPAGKKNWFKEAIYNTRFWVVGTLKKYITGKKEQGLAEALLIGYKDDLDKNLVQAYSNTGVVHLIAISGLHLGLIYGLLLLLTKPLKRIKRLRWMRIMLILVCLWLFSLLAGAGPSVMRSALMFSLLAVGESALKRTNIFNTLAFSAFALLCVNPFWLWDVGFQLSYAAVLSIVLFFQPIYNYIQFRNKLIDFFWKLSSVTLAAQILTLPISIYHFHQMPLLFLLTNFIAVPLAGAILVGELLLCAVSLLPALPFLIGGILQKLIYFMNTYIEQIDSLPFAVWNSLSVTLVQTFLLLCFSFTFCFWLMETRRYYARIAFTSLTLFMCLRGLSFADAYRQRKLVVYNVPKHPAIDIINGRHYVFLGDSALLFDGFERNFHLQPSRVLHRLAPVEGDIGTRYFTLGGKQLLHLDEALPFTAAYPKQQLSVVVLSKNPKLTISSLVPAFSIGQVVIDGSVPPWKAALWKKECDSLRIPAYDVSERGAFVMNW
jgi:competence protein ComEC